MTAYINPGTDTTKEYIIDNEMLLQWRTGCFRANATLNPDGVCTGCKFDNKKRGGCDFDDDAMQKIFQSRPHPTPQFTYEDDGNDRPQPKAHINPGTDTTINPVVIDDSYRERKKDPKGTQYDSGSGHVWTKIPPQRYIIDEGYIGNLDEWLSEHGIDELQRMQIRARLKLEPYSPTPAHPPEAQQRVDAAQDVIEAAINWWMMKRPLDYSEEQHMNNPKINCVTSQEDALAEAIALLQAGDPK